MTVSILMINITYIAFDPTRHYLIQYWQVEDCLHILKGCKLQIVSKLKAFGKFYLFRQRYWHWQYSGTSTTNHHYHQLSWFTWWITMNNIIIMINNILTWGQRHDRDQLIKDIVDLINDGKNKIIWSNTPYHSKKLSKNINKLINNTLLIISVVVLTNFIIRTINPEKKVIKIYIWENE